VGVLEDVVAEGVRVEAAVGQPGDEGMAEDLGVDRFNRGPELAVSEA
jgi:hypothetical protein